MLKRIHVRGFKSLMDVEVFLRPMTILYGPAATGKSNFLEALTLLSRIATSRDLREAWGLLRGTPDQSFAFGLDRLSLEADFHLPAAGNPLHLKNRSLRYHGEIAITPSSGYLQFVEESLVSLQPRRQKLLLDRSRYPLAPDQSLLSYDREREPDLAAVQQELASWAFYDLAPSGLDASMASASEVRDIGSRGEDLCAYLHSLRASNPRQFGAIERALEMSFPEVSAIQPEVDSSDRVHLRLVERGIPIPASLLSDAMLRMLGFLAALGKPRPLLAGFETPEAGFHPSQLSTVAELFKSQTELSGKQIVATTTSPTFVGFMAPRSAVFEVRKSPMGTRALKLKSLRRFTNPLRKMLDTFDEEYSF